MLAVFMNRMLNLTPQHFTQFTLLKNMMLDMIEIGYINLWEHGTFFILVVVIDLSYAT